MGAGANRKPFRPSGCRSGLPDRKLVPVPFQTLVRIFEKDGFTLARQEGITRSSPSWSAPAPGDSHHRRLRRDGQAANHPRWRTVRPHVLLRRQRRPAGALVRVRQLAEDVLNKKLNTGNLKVHVVLLPMPRDLLLPALNSGQVELLPHLVPAEIELVDRQGLGLTSIPTEKLRLDGVSGGKGRETSVTSQKNTATLRSFRPWRQRTVAGTRIARARRQE